MRAIRHTMGPRSSSAAPLGARCLVGCVAENNATYRWQAARLVRALRWFGGSMAAARVRVCVVDAVEPGARAELESLGAEVRIVPRFLARNPFANKLQLFLEPDWADAELVLLCDCDTVILRDPRPFLRGDVFQAKIADLPTVTDAVFARVFRHFGVPLPATEFVTDFRPTATIPYFNSGVVVLPRAVGQRVVPAWREVNAHLVEHLDLLGPCASHVNQASLTVALALLREPMVALDRALNFPVHLLHETPPPEFAACDPVIVHYHDQVDAEGRLREPPYPAAAARIRVFNDRLSGMDAPASRSGTSSPAARS